MIESEIVTAMEDIDVGSYTVARIIKDEHFCVELHYDSKQKHAWVEIETRVSEDSWQGSIEEAPWFKVEMFDDEILNKLYEIFKDNFSNLTYDDYYRFTQGVNFDGYDTPENSSLKKNEALCNVSEKAFESVKTKDIIEVDFNGDGTEILHYQVVRKDKKNRRLIIWLI